MRFQARLEESSLFKKIVVDTIKDFVKTVNIDVTDKGLSFQAMDAIHIAMTFTFLDKQAFEYYHCKRPLTLGVSVQNLTKVLKMGSSNDTLSLLCEEEDDDPSQLRIRFESKQGDRITEFNLDLLKIDSENYSLPDLTYETICSIPSSQYVRLCKQLFGVSTAVKIETSKQSIKFSVQSEMGSGSTTLRQKNAMNEKDSVVIDIDEPLSQSYSSNHLILFSRGSNLSQRISLHFANQAPMMVKYQILGGKGYIKYFLAPRIEQQSQ